MGIVKASAIPACLAAAAMTATPLAAAPMVVTPPVEAVWGRTGDIAQNHRRHGWGRGWDRHRHRDRMDAGDVVAGVLILGGIAAVVDAVRDSRDRRDRDWRNGDWRDSDWRERDWRDAEWPPQDEDRQADARGRDAVPTRERAAFEDAADACADVVEREARLDGIDAVERTAAGWQVRGTLTDGARFVCQVGSDGRVADVDYSLRRDRPLFEREGRDGRD